jgi:hypothetical protein
MNEIVHGGYVPLHLTLVLLTMASLVVGWLIFR